MIGLNHYNFGCKRNWRRWFWNRIKILAKANGLEINKTIAIYLLGPNDFDRKVALEKGFKDFNLIGIDINKNNIRKNKIGKKLLYCFDIFDFIKSYNGHPKIDILALDLCCGFNNNVRELIEICMMKCGHYGLNDPTIFGINLMRGRDSESNMIRDHINRFMKESEWGLKHRGYQVYYYWCYILLNEAFNSVPEYLYKDVNMEKTWNLLNMVHMPQFSSYKSANNRTIMDSVVFKMTFNKEKRTKEAEKIINYEEFINSKTKMRISGIKAVRKMQVK